ncbi:MAG: flagellar protein FliT [Gammaproteobacteria bacterium]|nr:flagellar protein FliT [Gammaproteobacteria bacterium]
MSTSTVEQLQNTSTALRDALAQQDWQAVGELDLQCRQAVDSAMSDPQQNSDELRERMQELLGLYRELVSVCQAEQQRIASELRQMNQSKQSAKVYQMFG